jgi:hypothetical protein
MAPKPLPSNLTWDEVEQAASVGVRRRIHSRKKGLNGAAADAEGNQGLGAWDIDIEAAIAEMAVAKATNRYWCGSVDTYHKGDDVQYGIQVRHAVPDASSLIVRVEDSDAAVWVLVTGRAPSFQLRGWFFGHEAKKQESWKKAPHNRDAAWFVPSKVLRDARDLIQRED